MPLQRPESEPRPATDADAEGWQLLDALRRKLDDQAAQQRRTHDQVQQLAESIAALVGEQRKRSRWLNLNSFVAYVIFTVLCGAGAYALYWSRSHELVEARDRAVNERDAAVKARDELAAKLNDQSAADKKASAAHAAEASAADREATLKTAVTAFKAGRFNDAKAPLEAAVAADPTKPLLHYYVGVIAAKDGELDKAIAHLSAAAAAEAGDEDVHFQLAAVLDKKSEFAKARVEYDKYATAHPQGQYAALAMRRSATLAKMGAPAVPVAPAPVAPKPVAPPPAPPPAAPPTPAPAPPAGSDAPAQ